MDPFEEAEQVIEESSAVEFGDANSGVSDVWIARAEERLGISLPPSYKWWLKQYGGGEVAGKEIYSIYETDFDTASGGDIVYMALVNQRNLGVNPKEVLFVCEPGTDEAYYLRTDERDSRGEYPVYRRDFISGVDEKYADNFLQFLVDQIRAVE